MNSRRPTMAEVAREAHVSTKTVSRVLHREVGVRPDTEERVRAVMQRLGFRSRGVPTVLAGRTGTIALVVEDLANPFYSQIGAAVEREARLRDYQLITASAEGSPTRERSVITGIVDRGIDGIVVVPASDEASVEAAVVAGGVAVAYVDRAVRGGHGDTVLSDNAGGVRSAIEHLVAHGHRVIGFLGDSPEIWTARQRRAAFVEVVESLGLPGGGGSMASPGAALVGMGPHTPESVAKWLRGWRDLPEPPTAVLTGNNRVTLATLHAMRVTGQRLSVVAYDDVEYAGLVDPPLTAIHQDPMAMGSLAAQQVFARLLGDESPPATIVVPTRLIVRGSSRRAPSSSSSSPSLAPGS